MPVASDYCGGYWAQAGGTEFVDSYASACAYLLEHAAGLSRGRVRGWTVSAADRQTSDPDGRPVSGYPGPAAEPLWVAAGAAGGRVLAAGIDFQYDAAAGTIWFDDDPLAWAPRRLAWVAGEPVEVADLLYCSADEAEPAAAEPATYAALIGAIAAACDSPASGRGEAVEAVWRGYDGVWRVVTDAAAYRLAPADEPAVRVGDVLRRGTPIGTAWELTKLGPAVPGLAHLTVPAYYHQGVTAGGITWYNAPTPTVVDTADDRLRVRWSLGGTSQGDVDAFWAASHATGTAAGGVTLAKAMDPRTPPPDTDPPADSLPAAVNPLEFVCRELFQGNAYLLVVYPDKFGQRAATSAARAAAVRAAAGPYATVFEYEDEMPALTPRTPS